MASNYTEASIKTLSSLEHIRLRPGMYIGRLGNGAHAEDGIYVLLKETIDNSIDEFTMGAGQKIEVELTERTAKVRDYGRGIPLGKLIDCVSIINTGAKYDSETFQKAVGLNGVGQKAVNALSLEYRAQAIREGQTKLVEFEQGKLKKDQSRVTKTDERNGTLIEFTPDEALFGKDFKFRAEFIEDMLWNYAFLNRGLTLTLNGKPFRSENGLKDLLTKELSGEPLYPIIHLEGEDIEVAFTHGNHYGEEYWSFVNGQHTTMGGTHLAGLSRGARRDRSATISRRTTTPPTSASRSTPPSSSACRSRSSSRRPRPSSAPPTSARRARRSRNSSGKFVQQSLDTYLHKNRETAEIIRHKIEENEHERKELAGIRNLARERAKKASLHNRKLRDCRLHLGDTHRARRGKHALHRRGRLRRRLAHRHARRADAGRLRAEGQTAQHLRPHQESHLRERGISPPPGRAQHRGRPRRPPLQQDRHRHRRRRGRHAHPPAAAFVLPPVFPRPVIRNSHLFILQTPLFRVRNKKDTMYCYTEQEKQAAVAELGAGHEITRFKGLGEISAGEFKDFIGENIRLDPVNLHHLHSSDELLAFFMGKNTPERQDFIIGNLRVEKDLIDAA